MRGTYPHNSKHTGTSPYREWGHEGKLKRSRTIRYDFSH